MGYQQAKYQVRFEWGSAGAAAISAGADAVVWVDQLGQAPVPDGLALPVLQGGIRNRRALAAWVLDRQAARGGRFVVAVVAAGELWPDGGPRFAVEDLLAAGAVIDALTDVGLDHCSPEAAAAAASFSALSNATKHLISASVTAQVNGRPVIDLTESAEVVLLRS